MSDLHHPATSQDVPSAPAASKPGEPFGKDRVEDPQEIEALRQQLRRIEDRLEYLVTQVQGSFATTDHH
jgi:hypothetical protein